MLSQHSYKVDHILMMMAAVRLEFVPFTVFMRTVLLILMSLGREMNYSEKIEYNSAEFIYIVI